MTEVVQVLPQLLERPGVEHLLRVILEEAQKAEIGQWIAQLSPDRSQVRCECEQRELFFTFTPRSRNFAIGW